MVYILQISIREPAMISPFTAWLRRVRYSTKQKLSFEQKLELARGLQERRVMVGGVFRDVVGLNEATAQVLVRIGDETKLYEPTDLVPDRAS